MQTGKAFLYAASLKSLTDGQQEPINYIPYRKFPFRRKVFQLGFGLTIYDLSNERYFLQKRHKHLAEHSKHDAISQENEKENESVA